MDLVQIDHTWMDVVVVDREWRLPIGRPWLTLAIDVGHPGGGRIQRVAGSAFGAFRLAGTLQCGSLLNANDRGHP